MKIKKISLGIAGSLLLSSCGIMSSKVSDLKESKVEDESISIESLIENAHWEMKGDQPSIWRGEIKGKNFNLLADKANENRSTQWSIAKTDDKQTVFTARTRNPIIIFIKETCSTAGITYEYTVEVQTGSMKLMGCASDLGIKEQPEISTEEIPLIDQTPKIEEKKEESIAANTDVTPVQLPSEMTNIYEANLEYVKPEFRKELDKINREIAKNDLLKKNETKLAKPLSEAPPVSPLSSLPQSVTKTPQIVPPVKPSSASSTKEAASSMIPNDQNWLFVGQKGDIWRASIIGREFKFNGAGIAENRRMGWKTTFQNYQPKRLTSSIGGITIDLTVETCAFGGMTYPFTALINLNNESYAGCARPQ